MFGERDKLIKVMKVRRKFVGEFCVQMLSNVFENETWEYLWLSSASDELIWSKLGTFIDSSIDSFPSHPIFLIYSSWFQETEQKVDTFLMEDPC